MKSSVYKYNFPPVTIHEPVDTHNQMPCEGHKFSSSGIKEKAIENE